MRKQVMSFMFLLVVGLVSAGISLPHAFNGEVEYSNGTIVSSGEIVAKIGSAEAGRANIVNGFYDLIVESEEDGVLINFYFGNELAGMHTFESFKVTELDFVIEVDDSDDENDNGGSSSSGSSSNRQSNGIRTASISNTRDNSDSSFISLSTSSDDSSISLSGQTEKSKGIPLIVPILIGAGILIIFVVVLVRLIL